MTGRVTDDRGTPVPSATVTVWHDAFVDSSVGVTDASGRYSVRFSSVRGSNAGPPGTELSVGMAIIEAPGYDWYARYVVAPTEQVVENFHLHLIHRIAAGESAVVTVAPHDRVCGIDTFTSRETICGVVHVVAPTDGTLTVQAVPAVGGSALHSLEVYGSLGGGRGNPISIRVTAGAEYVADLAFAVGFHGQSDVRREDLDCGAGTIVAAMPQTGAGVSIPFYGEFRYCQLESGRGTSNDCSQVPAEKTKYDPTNCFRVNQNVKPDSAAAALWQVR